MGRKKERFKYTADREALPHLPKTVKGYSITQHFYAHNWERRSGWSLCHKQSGLAIGPCKTLAMCKQFAEALEGCGVDWSMFTQKVTVTPPEVKEVFLEYTYDYRMA